MPEVRRYATATAFRTALEVRLRQQSGGSQTSLGRLRRVLTYNTSHVLLSSVSL